MKHFGYLIPLAALAAATLAAPALGAETAKDHQTIHSVAECLDLSRSPALYAPDNKTLIAKTGPKHFRIDLANECGRLNPATLTIRPALDKRPYHRLCGEQGDRVINAEGMACKVAKVTRIDEHTFRQLEAQSKSR